MNTAERYHRACAPFLAPGEQVLYGAHLAVASAVEETPLNLRIDIRGQNHAGADAARALEDAALRIRQGVKAVTAPADLVRELVKDKVKDKVHGAVEHKLHGALFEGGWQSHAGFLLRYVRACHEYGGPGASCAVTTQRLLVLRITQFDAPVLLVYAIPRGVIAGTQLRGTTVNSLFGRAPHAGLRFTDGSTLALDMTADQRDRFVASLGF